LHLHRISLIEILSHTCIYTSLILLHSFDISFFFYIYFFLSYSLRPKLYIILGRKKNCLKLYVALRYQYNINVTFSIITLTIYYFFFSILSFIFPILFIKDNFIKQLTISFFHTMLIAFFNICEMSKMSYNLGRMEYNLSINLSHHSLHFYLPLDVENIF